MTSGNNPSKSQKEVSLNELFVILWRRRLFILKGTIVGLVVGLIIGLTSPKEWMVKVDLIPELTQSSSFGASSFGGLAGLAGIQLPTGESNTLSPQLYPKILKSTPFLLALSELKVAITDSDSVQLQEFVLDFQKSGILGKLASLPGKALSLFSNNPSVEESSDTEEGKIMRISRRKEEAFNSLSGLISSRIDLKTGVVSVFVETQNKEVSAQIASFAIDYLVLYVRDYKTFKENSKLAFIGEQLVEREKEFRDKQRVLAEFKDRNVDIMRESSRIDLENLQNESNLAFDLYSTLRKQFEESKIKAQEEIPVIKVLEPVKVPNKKSKPRKLWIIFLSTVTVTLGIVVYVLISSFIKNF